jgi:L-lactate dehydrogenase (cytochrome)
VSSPAGTVLIDRALFNPLHPPGTLESNLAPESFKGRVDPKITAIAAAKQDAERARIASARAALPPVETILGIDEFEVCSSFIVFKMS